MKIVAGVQQSLVSEYYCLYAWDLTSGEMRSLHLSDNHSADEARIAWGRCYSQLASDLEANKKETHHV